MDKCGACGHYKNEHQDQGERPCLRTVNGHTCECPRFIEDVTQCSEPGCTEDFKDHRWGKIKAGEDGWFTEKSGKSWCPKHHPAWVAEWRAKRDAGTPPQPWKRGEWK